jgi:hypothetical protein
MLAFLFSLGLATLAIALARTRLLGGPHAWMRRALLPFLWFGSREWHTSFGEFSRRSNYTRQAWLIAWSALFLIMLLLLTVSFGRMGTHQ